jgi:hypothetical protein
MLPMLILGIVLALVLILVLRGMTAVQPRVLLRVLGWTLGGVLLGAFVFLVVTNRLSWALATLAALSPWGVRLLRILFAARRMGAPGIGGGGPGFRPVGGMFGASPGADPDPDDRSEVSTRFLDMTLSHATGAMSGTVRTGPFAGRALDSLDRAECLALWREIQADPESARVLDAWMERVRPDWREAAHADHEARDTGWDDDATGADAPPRTGRMSRAEALAVLGLDESAGPDEVKAAHRRLIVLVHPDRGGTPYLAARLNQARDVLLGGR